MGPWMYPGILRCVQDWVNPTARRIWIRQEPLGARWINGKTWTAAGEGGKGSVGVRNHQRGLKLGPAPMVLL